MANRLSSHEIEEIRQRVNKQFNWANTTVLDLITTIDRLKAELEQHKKQNPVFCDGGRNEDVYVLQEEIIKLQEENDIYKKHLRDLANRMLAEFEKDGWCRLNIKKEELDNFLRWLDERS